MIFLSPLHTPVFHEEVFQYWGLRSPGQYLDSTFGRGGHSALFQHRHPQSSLFVCDCDQDALGSELALSLKLNSKICANYSSLDEYFEEGFFDGILADLGMCSAQLDNPDRGLSFLSPGPLDMRLNQNNPFSLKDLIRKSSATDLANILYHYGEEKRSRPIAAAIKTAFEAGQLQTTQDLVRCITKIVPFRKGEKHPATRTFQALRIAVNEELSHLERFLRHTAPFLLKSEGYLVLISFHSLEYSVIKNTYQDSLLQASFRSKNFEMKKIIHPLFPTDTETQTNPRARSARLHVYQKRPL